MFCLVRKIPVVGRWREFSIKRKREAITSSLNFYLFEDATHEQVGPHKHTSQLQFELPLVFVFMILVLMLLN